MTNAPDPLDDLPASGGAPADDLHPAPEPNEISFPLVSARSREDLEAYGPNIIEDYRDFKADLLTWLSAYGKNPDRVQGLADSTLKSTHYTLETTFRWLWRDEEQYTTAFTPAHADRYIRLLDHSPSRIDSTVLHHAKAIKRLFKYTNHVERTEYEWAPEPELSQANGDERDYLRRAAFKPLYQATLEYSSVKSYHNSQMTPAEREQIKTYLAQRMGVPKVSVGPAEFKEANSWKIPSLIAITLGTGLRPVEVGRAKTHWVNLENHELVVPKEEATKNDARWNCSLKERTTRVLERWLTERGNYERYDGRDELWLTKQGTPYSSKSCNYILSKLIDEGDVPVPEHQDITWY